jgi:hypothetical protein
MKSVLVKFNSNTKPYEFKTDLNLNIGDIVVCDTAMGFTIATVCALNKSPTKLAKKWVLDKIDIDYEKCNKIAKIKRSKRL